MRVSHALCIELEQVLGAYFGARVRVAAVARRPGAYASSFSIEELTVRMEDGRELAIVRKDVSTGAILLAARRVKPRFLRDPMREIEAYRAIVTPSRAGPRFFGAIVDPHAGRYVLYMERVDGTSLSEIGEFAVWRAVARWLAAFHTRWSLGKQDCTVVRADHFLRYDREFFGRWRRRASTICRPGDPRRTQALGRVLRTHADAVDRLVEMDQSVLHGEFYASNILIEHWDRRICPVDWELTGLGPPLIDLAALIAGRWTDPQREELARAYFDALPSAPAEWESFVRDLDLCRLHLAIQWLGWSPIWTPPAEHAHDWLHDAAVVAERLNATG